MNDRPVAAWPMEAMVRTNNGSSALDKWMKDLKGQHKLRRHKGSTSKPSAPPKEPPKPAAK